MFHMEFDLDFVNLEEEEGLEEIEEGEGVNQSHSKQMQRVWLCLFSSRSFDDTFENAQWRKVQQMQPM